MNYNATKRKGLHIPCEYTTEYLPLRTKPKAMKAKIRTSPFDILIITDYKLYHTNIDFQDSSFFKDNKEADEWISEKLNILEPNIENLDELREKIRSAINRYIA